LAVDSGVVDRHMQLPFLLGFEIADGGREVAGETVVFAHCWSVSVVDATYLGRTAWAWSPPRWRGHLFDRR